LQIKHVHIASFFVTRFTRQQNPTAIGRFTMFPNWNRGKNMRLHLISGAVLVWTALALAAICLAELGATPQNVPF
jgi:hypothetical protein